MKKTKLILVSLIFAAALLGNLTVASAQAPTPQPGTITEGDQVVIANTYRLSKGNILNGSLGVIGSTASIDEGAVVTKSVFVVGGTLTIGGSVAGDIIAIGGAVNIGDSALIDGDITAIGATINRSPLAVIKGKITEQAPTTLDLNPTPAPSPVSPVGKLASVALQALLMASIAVVAALLLPHPIERVGNAFAEQPAIAGGVGLLVIVGFPIMLGLLIITVLLIPVALLAVIALFIIFVFGWIAIGHELGDRLSELFHITWAPAIASGIGTFLLTLVTASTSLIPWVGWILGVLVALFGIGSVIMARFGSPKYRPVPRTSNRPLDTSTTLPPA